MKKKNTDYRVAAADPSPIILRGLSELINELPDYEVIMATSDLRAASARLHALRPDILIVNPLMIDYAGRITVRDYLPDIPGMRNIAFVTGFCESRILKQYDGVIELNDDTQAVKSMLAHVVSMDCPPQEDNETALSDREKEVLVLLAKGCTNRKIAAQLNLSVNTINTHRKNIIRKTGIKSVSGLTVYAILNNLIEQKDII